MPNLLLKENYASIPPAVPERQMESERVVDEKRKPFVSEEHMQRHFGIEESRRVLYEGRRQLMRVPQPVLPPKPKSRDSIEREITMRSSRVPSAVEYANVQLRQKPTVNGNGAQYLPMTRHTLQALSAAPTPKLISNTDWMQARQATRKPANYNYNQHWLIQEAEQRRIEEARRTRAAQRHSYHQDIPKPAHPTQIAHPTHPAHLSHPAHPTHPAQLRDMHALSTSQQQLTSELKRSIRTEPREEKLLSVSGRRKCSHCGEELGRGAAMIIESLSLCYHVWCFTCAVCGAPLGDGRAGADVRVRAARLHCQHCYSSDDGRKYSAV